MQQYKPVTVSNPLADLAHSAVSHARSGQWEDAIKANRDLIALSPNDVESHNRLGKALSELGRVKDAIAAFQRAADLQPGNAIAARNLVRLKQLAGTPAAVTRVASAPKANPAAFMAARGSSVLTDLRKRGPARILAAATAGDRVALEPNGLEVRVISMAGEYLGTLEPRIGRRVARLSAGGNRYEATVAGFSGQSLSVLIREVYRSASQSPRTSFPPSLYKAAEDEGPSGSDEVRPDVLLDNRRSLRADIAKELDEEENPRARPELASRDLVGIGAALEEAAGVSFADR
jgi:tetratricopeptide (TPR) repeat protein